MFQADLDSAVQKASAPGAVGLVGRAGETLFLGASGDRQRTPARLPAETDTLYDLASLTKVVVTTTAIMQLRDAGTLDLEQPVSTLIPVKEFERFTVRQLLTHTAGLPSYRVWYKDVHATDDIIQRVSELELEYTPGTRRIYSDFGFILLGRIAELSSRERLDQYAAKHIFAPAGMEHACFNPQKILRSLCAATEDCPWRGRVMIGEVHDEHAFAVGGISGHAGLFAPAADLGRFCAALLGGKLLKRSTLEEMVALGQVPFYPWQGLGWKMDPWRAGSEGHLAGRRALGHTGWTGTCLWADLDTEYYALLLSNTPHPRRDRRNNGTLRRTFFQAVEKALYPTHRNTKNGFDRVVWNEFEAVSKKKLAVLTNRAAVDVANHPILKVLAHDTGHDLRRIYSPEHGFDGSAEAGAAVTSQGGAVPITSLYGKQKAPTTGELGEIDLFLVDLPDIGARYYTYMHTMKDCMEACAKAGVPMLVLDRPNPLGGVVVEGPVADVFGSAVCCAPLPVRHGLSLGELALFFHKHFPELRRLKLDVSQLDNWPRELMFDAVALPWNAPSPNIPTWETALMYVGTCLFEGVNLNEGRGTARPFLQMGAPWLDPEAVLKGLQGEDMFGCTLSPIRYTPVSIPGKASTPTYMNEVCQGLSFEITDTSAVRPFRTAMAVLAAIHQHHGAQMTWAPFFDTLAGGPWLRERLQGNMDAGSIERLYSIRLRDFTENRPKIYYA